jgi:transcriptional activator of cad operon
MKTDKSAIKIGQYDVEPSHNRLIKGDEIIELEPLAMAMLLLLAKDPGAVVSNDELFAKLWQGKVVTDNALHRIVRQLRKAFGDKADDPQYIRTVRKSGYVLISSVETQADKLSNVIKFSITAVLLVFSLLGYYIMNNGATTYQLQNTQQLTSLPGVELSPTLWSQQNAVIFTHQLQGELYNNIVVRPLDSSQYRYLTDDYLHYANLKLSQDGRYLAFVLRDVRNCTINYADLTQVVFKPVALAKCRFEGDFQLAWSTDSNQLYYNKSGKEQGNSQLMTIGLKDKSNRNLLTDTTINQNDYSPSVEPGGQRVAYLRYTKDDTQIRLFDAQSHTDILLKQWDADDRLHGVNWLGNAQALLLNTKSNLLVLSLNGQLSEIENNLAAEYSQPSIDATGKLVYAQTTYSNQLSEFSLPNTNMAVIKERFSGQPMVPSSKSEYSGYYASDGQTIAFLSNRESQGYRLWLLQKSQVKLLYDKPVASAARWSIDNSQLVFITKDNQIATLVVASGKTTVHDTPTPQISKVNWGHHNTLIYFSQRLEGQHQLFKMDLSSKKPTQLTESGGFYMQASNDGRYLYYNKYNQTGLWRLDLATNNHQLILPDFHSMNYASWQAFDEGLYYVRDANAARGLFFFDFGSSQQRQLIDNKEFYRFDVSPDQSRVLLSTKKSLIGDLHYSTLVRR